MRIESSGLIAALNEAPEELTLSPYEVSEYVMEHIFKPLRLGESLGFADLDFEAFTDEDIRELETWIDRRERMTCRLADLGRIFCEAKPVSSTGRAFC